MLSLVIFSLSRHLFEDFDVEVRIIFQFALSTIPQNVITLAVLNTLVDYLKPFIGILRLRHIILCLCCLLDLFTEHFEFNYGAMWLSA